jgi:hypothetical protein
MSALMMEAARISETSADMQLRTWQYIPEDSELHTRRRENLKSHIDPSGSFVIGSTRSSQWLTFLVQFICCLWPWFVHFINLFVTSSRIVAYSNGTSSNFPHELCVPNDCVSAKRVLVIDGRSHQVCHVMIYSAAKLLPFAQLKLFCKRLRNGRKRTCCVYPQQPIGLAVGTWSYGNRHTARKRVETHSTELRWYSLPARC